MSRKGSDLNSSEFEKLNLLDDNALVELSHNCPDSPRGRLAVSALVSRYFRLVQKKAYCFACDYAEPEDLAQEGFLSFLNAVNSFDAARGTKFSSFADVCITNGIRSAVLKLGKKSEESFSEAFEEKIGDGLSPENIWFEKETMFDIYDEIASLLSEKEWSIFKLYLDGASYKEISEKLDISLKSVDNAVFRVRKKLKALFSHERSGI